MNRALRAAAMGALLLSPVALSACSAGQVTQTNTQEQNFGAQIDAGSLSLRALELPYPTGGTYPVGSEARLLGAVVSTADTPDTLVGITGDAFTEVEVVDPAAAAAAPAPGAAPAGISIPVPADGALYLSNGQGPAVTLIGLTEELGVGQYIDVTFTFTNAGDVTVSVPVGVAQRDLPRGEAFDFHPEEEEEQQGGGSAP